MKKTILWAVCLSLLASPVSAAIIVDHRHTDVTKIPSAWLDKARSDLRVTYQHTSHGSQLVTGISAFRGDSGSAYYYTYSSYGYDSAVFLNDYGMPGADDLGSPNRSAWAAATYGDTNSW